MNKRFSDIDMHMHSRASDGTDTPESLITAIRKQGIKTFSLTDHDTIKGTMEVERLLSRPSFGPSISGAVSFDPENSLTFFRGIEFSCRAPVRRCHILGYDFDPENASFREALRLGKEKRDEKLLRRLDYLKNTQHIIISEKDRDELMALEICGKPHMAKVLIRMGYAATITEAIEKYLKYIPGEKYGEDRILAEMAISAILDSGGIPVWAHPLRGIGEKPLSKEDLEKQLQFLIAYGIRGLECYYSLYTEQEAAFLLEKAEKYHLAVSAGSDYHGTNKTVNPGELNAFGKILTAADITLLDLLGDRSHSHPVPDTLRYRSPTVR